MDVLTNANGRLQNGFRKLRPNNTNTAAAMEEGRGQDSSPGPGHRDKVRGGVAAWLTVRRCETSSPDLLRAVRNRNLELCSSLLRAQSRAEQDPTAIRSIEMSLAGSN